MEVTLTIFGPLLDKSVLLQWKAPDLTLPPASGLPAQHIREMRGCVLWRQFSGWCACTWLILLWLGGAQAPRDSNEPWASHSPQAVIIALCMFQLRGKQALLIRSSTLPSQTSSDNWNNWVVTFPNHNETTLPWHGVMLLQFHITAANTDNDAGTSVLRPKVEQETFFGRKPSPC